MRRQYNNNNNNDNSSLGSLISSYRKKAKRQFGFSTDASSSFASNDINKIVKRLEEYKEYQRIVRREKKEHEKKQEKKLLGKIKKESFRKAYGIKPVANPYLRLSTGEELIVTDSTMKGRYQSYSLYSFYEFRHMTLPRSNHKITAGKAWNGLINAWHGYRISNRYKDEKRMQNYARSIQRFAYLLELDNFTADFEDIGLSAESFNNAKKLKLLDEKEDI